MRSPDANIPEDLILRQLQPADSAALRHLHNQIFPIDYDDSFFSRAVSQDGIIGWAAVAPQCATDISEVLPDSMTVFVGAEQLVGFITARIFTAIEIPVTDRQLLNLADKEHDNSKLMYILTLGVVPRFRHRKIACALLDCVEKYAERHNCYSLHLHVISYNEPARQFYSKAGFGVVAELPRFYYIATGRALHPDVQHYDACLYTKRLHSQKLATPSEGLFPTWPSFMDPLWQLSRNCPTLLWPRKIKVKLEDSDLEEGSTTNSTNGHINNSTTITTVHRHPPQWLRGLFGGGRGPGVRSSGVPS